MNHDDRAAAIEAPTAAFHPRGSAQATTAGDESWRSLTIPGCEVVGELGRGGMGQVLRVRDADLDRPLAVKLLLPRYAALADFTERFLAEARVTGQLQHPGVPPVHAVGRLPDGRPYFSMKLIEGQTFAELLRSRRDPHSDLSRAVAVYLQVCQTIAYAHSQGVIHRDLKPHNVMVGAFGEVQVMDWGLARGKTPSGGTRKQAGRERTSGGSPESTHVTVDAEDTDLDPLATLELSGGAQTKQDDARLTQVGQVLGTLQYMPPEQARGDIDDLDERGDVFSLGAMLCEILTGVPPYLADDKSALHERAACADLTGALDRLDGCGADVELISLAKRCLSPDANDRPRDAAVLAGEVTAYLESVEARLRQAEVDRAAAVVQVREERKRRKLTLGLASSLLIVLALLASAALWIQSQRADTRRNAETALAKAEQSRQQAQMPRATSQETAAALVVLRQAQAAVEEAESVLDIGMADEDVRRQVAHVRQEVDQELAQLVREERLFRDLHAARMARLTIVQTATNSPGEDANDTHRSIGANFDYVRSARLFAQAFADYGMTHVRGDTPSAARRISGERHEVREALLSALDVWADAQACAQLPGQLTASELRELAQQIDEDAGRLGIRAALLAGDTDRMKRLAEAAEGQNYPPGSVEIAAMGLWSAGERPLALKLLRAARSEHPSDFWIEFNLGFLLCSSEEATPQDLDESIGCYWASLAIEPGAATAYTNLGFALYAKSDWEGAAAACRKAVAIDARDAVAHCNLGVALVRLNDLPGAVVAFRLAIEANPHSAQAHFNLGTALATMNETETALSALKSAAELNPGLAEAHFNLGIILAAKNDLKGAAAAYRATIEADPRHSAAYNNLGNVLSGQHDLDGAILMLRKAVEVNPRLADGHYNLGNVLYAKQDLEGAASAFRQTIEIDPQFAKALVMLGIVLRDQGDLNGAIDCQRRAIDIDPQLAEAHTNLGSSLMDSGNIEGAVAASRAALEINPQSAAARLNLAAALVAQGELDEGLAEYRKAIECHPQSAVAHFGLGLALMAKKDFAGAISAYRTTIGIDPQFGDAHRNLGISLASTGDLDGAIVAFRAAIEIDPDNRDAIGALGMALAHTGKFAEGRQHMRRCLDMGTPEGPFRQSITEQLAACEYLIAIDAKMSDVLAGKAQPADNDERLGFVAAAQLQEKYATAARFYAEAFADDPALAEALQSAHRFKAACCAARAGSGEAADAGELSEDARAKLRQQAITWLNAELSALKRKLSGGDANDQQLARDSLRHWLHNAALESLREEDQIDRLSSDEQAACRQLWAEVAAALKEFAPQ